MDDRENRERERGDRAVKRVGENSVSWVLQTEREQNQTLIAYIVYPSPPKAYVYIFSFFLSFFLCCFLLLLVLRACTPREREKEREFLCVGLEKRITALMWEEERVRERERERE